jgi:ABC-2 type transport system ATP-binding protein
MRLTIQRLKRELGLTILLSSHLLNEVEQLCTRICVLNKGAKVFEGTLEETRRSGRWVHLVAGDWAKATQCLEGEGLISGHRDGRLVSMMPDVETSRLVCALVAAGIKVHEIAREEESLETFYLGLMDERQSHVPGVSTQAATTPN